MHKSLTFIKEFFIPKKDKLIEAYASFSKKELSIFIVAIAVSIFSVLLLLGKINSNFMVSVPINGGSLTEGIIGMPTLVNPVLALSQADKDMTSIIYSGLMRKSTDGSYIPDLAQSYTVSPNGLTYTFIIKDDAKFHDGKKVTADDILFTINKIKDPLIKNPHRNGWDGITVNKVNDNTVSFTLKQPYISFMDSMTVGILPMHIWKNVSIPEFGLSPLNINAVGSGPYQIESVIKNNDGFPKKYILKRFKNFTLGVPHIGYLNIVSFTSEDNLVKAMKSHSIDQAGGISPENAKSVEDAGYSIHTSTLSRTFGLFFNINNSKILASKGVIDALDKAINREAIIKEALYGYGSVIHDPIPDSILQRETENSLYKNSHTSDAIAILEKDGWRLAEDGIMTKGGVVTETKKTKVRGKTVEKQVEVDKGPVVKFSFSLSTGNTPELKHTAEIIKKQLGLIGVQVDIKIYETGQLNQLIRSRDYESLFFGQVINHESDLYSFWHSSQRKDPGLNIAMYNNKNIDTILGSIYTTTDAKSRKSKYENFIKEFNKNLPALLIYSPKYIYATSEGLNNIYLNSFNTSSDRFNSVYKWYANQEKVWKIFSKSNNE